MRKVRDLVAHPTAFQQLCWSIAFSWGQGNWPYLHSVTEFSLIEDNHGQVFIHQHATLTKDLKEESAEGLGVEDCGRHCVTKGTTLMK